MNIVVIIILFGFTMLAVGLVAIYFFMKHFTEKAAARDREDLQVWQEGIMAKIDEVFPTLTELMEQGIPQPAHTSSSEDEASRTSRHQSDEDATVQTQLAEENGHGAEERQEQKPLFPPPNK
ncbi:MAG: hypothetical protein LBK47_08050 [Prevotellaceae bacterium]|jgi:hypothetical protein|nr:hypothetical protein [Prevotellaceae bacterium]